MNLSLDQIRTVDQVHAFMEGTDLTETTHRNRDVAWRAHLPGVERVLYLRPDQSRTLSIFTIGKEMQRWPSGDIPPEGRLAGRFCAPPGSSEGSGPNRNGSGSPAYPRADQGEPLQPSDGLVRHRVERGLSAPVHPPRDAPRAGRE